jgi:hypothetical protein
MIMRLLKRRCSLLVLERLSNSPQLTRRRLSSQVSTKVHVVALDFTVCTHVGPVFRVPLFAGLAVREHFHQLHVPASFWYSVRIRKSEFEQSPLARAIALERVVFGRIFDLPERHR